MKRILSILAAFSLSFTAFAAVDVFPDGTPIPDWFKTAEPTDISTLGQQYMLTDYNILPDGRVHTAEIQALIDKAAAAGGGVIVVPQGIFMTGPLYFKQGTHLYLREGAVLMASDRISDYPVVDTRIEGESCKYYPAVINVDGVDGFTISGKGTIDGNGMEFWKAFWKRRSWNPQCTNKDEQRPRLVFVSNSKNVQFDGVNLQNSAFWTTHFYKCENVKMLNLRIFSPYEPVKAPSTDAIDIDVVTNMLVKNCYMHVNDDAVVLKGGKGPWADDYEKYGNGMNQNIIVEDCVYGFCHGCLTCGSESVHNRNIIVRRIKVESGHNLLWLKMRPDTPQRYEYILVEDIEGNADNMIYVYPWTQFYDLKGRKDIPKSYSDHITMRNINLECKHFFNTKKDESQFEMSNFVFENMNIKAEHPEFHPEYVKGFKVKNVVVNGKKQ